MAKEVLHVFKVKQAEESYVYHNFPIDMLRYDRCHPANQNDSANITMSFNLKRGEGSVGEINLCRYAHRQWTPHKERWRSFGWEVVAEGKMEI